VEPFDTSGKRVAVISTGASAIQVCYRRSAAGQPARPLPAPRQLDQPSLTTANQLGRAAAFSVFPLHVQKKLGGLGQPVRKPGDWLCLGAKIMKLAKLIQQSAYQKIITDPSCAPPSCRTAHGLLVLVDYYGTAGTTSGH
jgi:hypothetical protein